MKKISSEATDFLGVPFFPENSVHNQVIMAVVHSFKRVDWATKLALEEFLDTYRRRHEEEEKREVVKELSNKEIVGTVIQVHRAHIELAALGLRLADADERYRIVTDNAKLAIKELEGIDLDFDSRLDIFRLKVFRIPDDENARPLQKGVEFVRALADGSAAVPLESVCKGTLPADVREAVNELWGIRMDEFFADIAEVMVENGDAGKQAVLDICDDAEVAKEMAANQDAPRPLKFLAEIVLKHVKKPSKESAN